MIGIIKKPIISEKAMEMGSQRQYAFEVVPTANKIEIKKAVEELYEVKVESVRTLRMKGKIKLRHTRKGLQKGKTAMRKKEYITLQEGYTIEIVSGGQED
jgi:large subunit ribosomal protein L23